MVASAKNLVLIGQGLQSVDGLITDASYLESVNLHLNNITSLKCIQDCCNLEHLDISSNQLETLNGLDDLKNLITANFACNSLTSVSSVGNLSFLTHLNLSYNKIRSLNGFLELHGIQCSLEVVELHGNLLDSVSHVAQCFSGVTSLKHLVLEWQTESNPLCTHQNYRNGMLSSLPQLISLDHLDRQNQLADLNSDQVLIVDEIINSIITSVPEREHPKKVISTPNIDAIMMKRRSECDVSNLVCKVPTSMDLVEENNENKTSTKLKDQPSVSTDSSSLPEKSSSSAAKGRLLQSRVPKYRKLRGKENKENSSEQKPLYTDIYRDLERERERRCKAEEACKRLLGDLKQLQIEKEKSGSIKEMATETADKMKQVLIRQKESNDQLKAELQMKAKAVKTLSSEQISRDELLKGMENKIVTLDKYLDKAKKQYGSMKHKCNEKIKAQETEFVQLKQCYEETCVDLDAAKRKVNNLEKQLLQKELDHKTSLNGLFSTDSPEFQNAVSLRVNREEKRHQQELDSRNKEISGLRAQYKELEEEFREALMIEADRFDALSKKYSFISEKYESRESKLKSLQSKDERSQTLVVELSNVVKQQKIRIEELDKAKLDLSKQNKELLSKIEDKNEENKDKCVQIELLKKDKAKYYGQVSALQSVIEGLKEEKKLWGLELAHQSSSLAKDRGRLEMKIESLKAENNSLRKNNERDLDSLRIKIKVVEDQTETIRRMKEALGTKDAEIKAKLESQLNQEKMLQDDVAGMQQEIELCNKEKEELLSRKDEYKSRLSKKIKEYEQLILDHENLQNKWEETTQLLGTLENQVKKLSANSKEREAKLTKERNDAHSALKVMNGKMNRIDDEIKKQLEIANFAHIEEMKSFEKNKQQEVYHLRQTIASVENEMKILLQEKKRDEEEMENKCRKLKEILNIQSL